MSININFISSKSHVLYNFTRFINGTEVQSKIKNRGKTTSVTIDSANKATPIDYFDVVTICEVFTCDEEIDSRHFNSFISSNIDTLKSIEELAHYLQLDILGVCLSPPLLAHQNSKWGPTFIQSALKTYDLLSSKTPKSSISSVNKLVIIR